MKVYLNKVSDIFILADDQESDAIIDISQEERDVINKAETLFLNIQDFIQKKMVDKQIQ